MGGPAEGEGWREWLARRAHRYRRTLLSHRDGARLVAAGDPGPGVARSFEEELRTLTGLGFTPARGLHAITAISHYTLGFVLNEQARLDRRGRGDSPGLAAYATDYPLTVEGSGRAARRRATRRSRTACGSSSTVSPPRPPPDSPGQGGSGCGCYRWSRSCW
ncbi:TetR/AcrR family transcriptional regulator C-terminal domain-containing protein [Nonomuraea thailandensis]